MYDLQTSPSVSPSNKDSPSTILVVDDVPENLRLLSTTLTHAGYDVRSAINGAVAMKAIAVEHPDLILLDVTMPEIDGFEVCRQLKSNPATTEVPVVFISALGEVIDKVKAFQVGGVDYITKPFQIAEVLARVHSQLELGRLKQQLRSQNQQLTDSLQQQQQAEAQIRQLNLDLEQRVLDRTQQLQLANQSLQAEIQERQQAQTQLLHMAMYDPLTGLANRTLLLERLDHILSHNQPSCQDESNVALLLLDCARFETITDTLGHLRGDQLLTSIASRIVETVSANSLVARLRGDEFAILLNLSAQAIEGFVETLQQALSIPIDLGKYEVIINPSIGVAFSSTDDQEAEHLFRDAYQAMVRAKAQGTGKWRLFEPEMHQQALHRLTLEGKLHRAVQQNQFQVHYQPIVALAGESEPYPVVGFEALVRWQPHPDSRFISPAEFIPLAEETGLILPLGDWVFETACQQIREWNRGRSAEQALFMSVNFSVHQLNREQVAEHIEAIISKTDVQPHWLKLEITESVLMANPKTVLHSLEQLRSQGLQVSIDDFGTGYSSLSYLQELPVDILKIDRAFIKDLESSSDDLRILETILSLARALDLNVVAEGIETQHQADCLGKLGSHYGQGYRFSKPLDSASASKLLQQVELDFSEIIPTRQ